MEGRGPNLRHGRAELDGLAKVNAGANALALHFVSSRQQSTWDTAPRPPLFVRMAGLVSILLWATVIVAGRMMSYTMFSAP